MSIGNQISIIRQQWQLTQEQFGNIFCVTRQTVSNWENEKIYPDLQTLIRISDHFEISLDILLKEDKKMIQTFDKERLLGSVKRQKTMIEAFTGAGTGAIVSCLFSPYSIRRPLIIFIGMASICIGWFMQAVLYKRIFQYINENVDS